MDAPYGTRSCVRASAVPFRRWARWLAVLLLLQPAFALLHTVEAFPARAGAGPGLAGAVAHDVASCPICSLARAPRDLTGVSRPFPAAPPSRDRHPPAVAAAPAARHARLPAAPRAPPTV